jgi:hypothetical protein
MKTKYFYIPAFLLLILACGDEHVFDPLVDQASTTPAKFKFVHAATDTVGVNLFASGTKLTGNSSTTITTYGSVNIGKVNIGTVTVTNSFPVTGYGSLDGGTASLSAVVPEAFTATLSYPTKTIVAKEGVFSASQFHTVALLGISPAYDLVVYDDDMTQAPLDGNIYIRFANFIDNLADPVKVVVTPPATTEDPAPVPITLFQGVLYKGMTDFAALPRRGTYKNLQIINETTSAVVYTLTPATSTFYTYVDNKVYTIFAKGRIGGAGAAAPGLGRMINR